jgi:hypothetical protein
VGAYIGINFVLQDLDDSILCQPVHKRMFSWGTLRGMKYFRVIKRRSIENGRYLVDKKGGLRRSHDAVCNGDWACVYVTPSDVEQPCDLGMKRRLAILRGGGYHSNWICSHLKSCYARGMKTETY